jgi:hypothetical protein
MKRILNRSEVSKVSELSEVEVCKQSVTACRLMFYLSWSPLTWLSILVRSCGPLLINHGSIRLLSVLEAVDPVNKSATVPNEFPETCRHTPPNKDRFVGGMGSEYAVESDGTCESGHCERGMWYATAAGSGMCTISGDDARA